MEPNQTPSTQPNLNPTPKTRFRESANNISEHRAMVETRPFQRACDFALLEYQAYLASWVAENPQSAAFAGLKLTGAQEFLTTMRALSESPRLMPKLVPQNLDHKV